MNIGKFDYSELLGDMKRKGYTQATLAEKTGISLTSLNEKLNNKKKFNQIEMFKICNVMEEDADKVSPYFFKLIVQKSERKGGKKK